MPVTPKFILSDQVCYKHVPDRVMSIKRFEADVKDRQIIYTGYVLCFWFENGKPVKRTFHEDELILAKN